HQCPTAAFLNARAACRIRTPESLICATPLSPSVSERSVSTASLAVSACTAIRRARTRMVPTMITATTTTIAPSPRPMYQEVVSAPISIPLPHRLPYQPCLDSISPPPLSVQGLRGSELRQVVGELLDHPLRHRDDHALPHLGGLAGDVDLGVDRDLRLLAAPGQLHRDLGRGVALSAGLLRARIHDGAMLRVVLLDDLGGPGVVHRHRPELDLDLRVDGAVARLLDHPRPRDARHDPLEVDHRAPDLVDRLLHRERIVELHLDLLSPRIACAHADLARHVRAGPGRCQPADPDHQPPRRR